MAWKAFAKDHALHIQYLGKWIYDDVAWRNLFVDTPSKLFLGCDHKVALVCPKKEVVTEAQYSVVPVLSESVRDNTPGLCCSSYLLSISDLSLYTSPPVLEFAQSRFVFTVQVAE